MSGSTPAGPLRRRLTPVTLVALFFAVLVSLGLASPAAASTPVAASGTVVSTTTTAPASLAVTDGTAADVEAAAYSCKIRDYCGPFGSESSCENARRNLINRGYYAPEPCFYWGGGGVPNGWYFFWFH
ncbi:hypothetical protein [Virgisporangium aurantiacum]|uniref:Uncharacterized protein n=1 Tax=Virgisporangium aurantiacum TaxID=175570 RepID=A0A8J4E5U1_9ACTN|nr:hypothetical protein [Virgisporangium aurantiacum]GIJ62499.1 hypothetical protein Vau01_100150 [Virgisporangium aurantiacum]